MTLYVRLGEFHVDGAVGPREVMDFVRRSFPEEIRPWIDDLDRSGRLVLVFDGMDEMSRARYNEHTEALSEFAGARPPGTRTLFSCRVTDFSPAFVHRRLVLLPFERTQIARYLKSYLPAPSLVIDGERWTLPRLARRLAAGGLEVDASNPFVLWLLCLFLVDRQTWPASRVQLLAFFNEENYERKRHDAAEEGSELPPREEAFREWSRLAFVIAERNRGAALPVADLLAGAGADGAARALSALRAGKHCGVLAESLQGTEHQIRFQHHRFQEYFTACWIFENRLLVDWLDKLDAPRWQETMLNLALLGGADDGVAALAAAIGAGAESFRAVVEAREEAPETPAPYAEEAALADRVELGARLIRQAGKATESVCGRLLPAIEGAVGLLAGHGKPVTQVKMLRACQALESAALVAALEKPLRSPVRWVRDQALILLAAQPGNAAGRAYLATEMGVELATLTFLARWPVFFRGARANREAGSWLALASATLCALVHLAFLVAVAVAIPMAVEAGMRWFDEDDALVAKLQAAHSLASGHLLLLQLALAVVALALTARRPSTWIWCLVSVSGGTAGLFLCAGLARGDWDAFNFLILPVMAGLSFWVPAVVCAGVHGLVLAGYAVTTGSVRRPGLPASAFMSIAWKECSYRAAVRRPGLFFLLTASVSGAAFGLFLGVDELTARWGLPELPIVVVVFGAASAVVYLGYRTLTAPSGLSVLRRLRLALAALWTLLRTQILTGVVLAAAFLGFDHLFERLAPFFHRHTLDVRSAQVLAFLLLAVALWILADQVFWLLRHALAQRQPFPPGTFTPETWTALLKKAGPRRQEDFLRRTTHQSLSLLPVELYTLLIEVEPLIKKEPALSTYWDRRDQLEQALRQERQG